MEEIIRIDGRGGDMTDMRGSSERASTASVVIDGEGWVIKDRNGATPRRATPEELADARDLRR